MNMIITKKYLILVLGAAFFPLFSSITQIHDFRQALDSIQQGALVLIDIDNTLVEPSDQSQIGSDQWFSRVLLASTDHQQAVAHYCSVVLNADMQLVEPTIPDVIASIQSQALVIGFTMRSLVLGPCTAYYLKGKGIIFNNQLPDRGFMIDGTHPVMLYNGTLFCQGKKDGHTLFTVLDSYNIMPTTIIMIDDKQHYLKNVERECELRSIPFIGLRYGHLDDKVKQFISSTISAQQLELA